MTLLFFGGSQLGASSSALDATVENCSRQRNETRMRMRHEVPVLEAGHSASCWFVNAVCRWRKVSEDQSAVDPVVFSRSMVSDSIFFGGNY
ncbi:MAG: hypothetical protein WKF77_30365 [Planctomycetaceae bacterium]